MHIPDGFISNSVSAPLLGAAAVAAGYAVRKVRAAVTERIPVLKKQFATFPASDSSETTFQLKASERGKTFLWRMASVAAFIFAAQMINFPVASGTSGHLLGGVLAALILGPWAGFLVITLVLTIQAFLFGDGGVIALGANIINMGIIGTVGGWYLFQGIYRALGSKPSRFLSIAFVVAWLSVVLAAAGASLELGASRTIPLYDVLPAMLGTHALIGLGEGLITVALLFFLRSRKETLAALTSDNNNGYEE